MIMGLVKGYNKARWVHYDVAKSIVQAHGGLTSRSKYWKWHEKSKPRYIPKQPNRVYPEWVSWNDFLGVDNSFAKELNRKRMITRPYWEAVRWVQAQSYKTAEDYKNKYDAEVPKDIPKMPQEFYKTEWQGWGTFLGTNIRSRIMSKTEELGLLAICTFNGPSMAGNMFEIVVDDDGISTMQAKLSQRPDLVPIKAYHYLQSDKPIVADILNKYASHQHGNVYLAVSMNDVTFQFDTALEIYRPT